MRDDTLDHFGAPLFGRPTTYFFQTHQSTCNHYRKEYVQLYPQRGLELARKLIEHFGDDGTVFDSTRSASRIVLGMITQRYPIEVWELVTKYIGPPIDTRAFHLKEWLRGGDFFGEKPSGILSIIPLTSLWNWVDQDVENRAGHIANFVPKDFVPSSWESSLTRMVLVRYGHRDDVRSNLNANYFTEGWTGEASKHYHNKLQQILELQRVESNKNVLLWIDECIDALERSIEREMKREEREGY